MSALGTQHSPRSRKRRTGRLSTVLGCKVHECEIRDLDKTKNELRLEHDTEVFRLAFGYFAVRRDPDNAYEIGVREGVLTRRIRQTRRRYEKKHPPLPPRYGPRKISGRVRRSVYADVMRFHEASRYHSLRRTVRLIYRACLRQVRKGGEIALEYLRGHYAGLEMGADSPDIQTGIYRNHKGEECFWFAGGGDEIDVEREYLDDAEKDQRFAAICAFNLANMDETLTPSEAAAMETEAEAEMSRLYRRASLRHRHAQRRTARKARAAETSAKATSRTATRSRAPRSSSRRRAQASCSGESRAGPDTDGDDPPPPRSGSSPDSGEGVPS